MFPLNTQNNFYITSSSYVEGHVQKWISCLWLVSRPTKSWFFSGKFTVCWEKLTFHQSFFSEHQFFLFESCHLDKKRRSKVMETFRKFVGWGQKPSVIDLSQNTLQHGCYRHYSVIFHGKGMTVQCDPTWWYQVSTLHSEKSLSNQKVHPWLSKSNVTNSTLKLPRRKFQ